PAGLRAPALPGLFTGVASPGPAGRPPPAADPVTPGPGATNRSVTLVTLRPLMAAASALLRQVEIGNRAVEDLGRHRHRFAERRVRMDGVADVGDLAAHLDCQR